MMQAVLRVQEQALGLIMMVLFGRHRRRGMAPETEAGAPETKRLWGWEWLLLPAISPATSILVGALQLPRRPRKKTSERRKSDGNEGSRPRRTLPGDGKPLFGELTMAPLLCSSLQRRRLQASDSG
jgi:hypothetical protein